MNLDIIGTDWSFALTDSLPENTLGHCDGIAHSIQIRQDVLPGWKLYLLLHEVLHSMTFLGHLQFLRRTDCVDPVMDDEAKVDALSSVMAHFITHNKTLIDTIILEDYHARQLPHNDARLYP